jgi:hypothetical protein
VIPVSSTSNAEMDYDVVIPEFLISLSTKYEARAENTRCCALMYIAA